MINNIFYSGYNHQVIACLDEIARICNGQYKRATQIKLLNSLSIILTQQINAFPYTLEESFIPRDQDGTEVSRDTMTSEGNSMRGSDAASSKESFMKRNESGGSISNEPSKPHSLKDFYLKVLDKRNQQFLFELTKQTHTMAG